MPPLPIVANDPYFFLPAIRKPHGYCVHKPAFGSKHGVLTKLELFAYFPESVLQVVEEQIEGLEPVRGSLPVQFTHNCKYTELLLQVVYWHKAPVQVKCYTQKRGGPMKLEVTRVVWRERTGYIGRKFLDPICTLNSLGECISFLTKDVPTVYSKTHDDFFFVDEFQEECRKLFSRSDLRAQLRLLKQKLRGDLQFGFRPSGVPHYSQYIM